MLLEIKNLKQNINDDEPLEAIIVKMLSSKRLKLSEKEIKITKILKKSIDARKKDNIQFMFSVLIELEANKGERYKEFADNKDIFIYEEGKESRKEFGTQKINNRPIIIGSGPAGLFAGLVLAQNGYKPLLIERGKDVDARTSDIGKLFNQGSFSAESNIQFGEGGAGTFSDGKLTTRIKDRRCDMVLRSFIQFGAPEEIQYINKPHIGTDILKAVVKNMRNKIIELGGEVRFLSKVTDIVVEAGEAKAVVINEMERIDCNIIIAAIGHSARDTYHMLFQKGARMISKPFSIGVRVEHLQSMIDAAQYGKYAGHPKLGAADYQLSYKSERTGRTAYSFCMCPGGMVVAAASEKDMIVTNGMSEYKRDRQNANSALVVSVSPEDFESNHPLSGIEYQRHWESLAYKAGGGNYNAPVQLVGDLLRNTPSNGIGSIKPSYLPGVLAGNLNECLPRYVISTIQESLCDFDRKIKGFASNDAVLIGVETRTSAPLRIIRKEDMESENIKNLYPIGEGAGYAGGIVSAAVDGIKAAEKIMEIFKPA